eukprot:CAMPEP_0117448398 /NCGR_PEP_ID=MMETSP0759-20121206/7377_1 /TAXON_ID=63605 /ORGANISM="Percolomonas cosmopolitus, Strain WS" /LENGTH=50 /DNA_ID=CAMNT_0005240777 /DNA_START=15 /DNA_END=167 /DNA_ORIENTATION=-
MKKTLIIVDPKARVKDVLRDEHVEEEEEVLQGVEKITISLLKWVVVVKGV